MSIFPVINYFKFLKCYVLIYKIKLRYFFIQIKSFFPRRSVKGGKIPEITSHLVIDKPESVSLVKPPTITIIKSVISKDDNQKTTSFLCSIFSKNIYISYILFKIFFVYIYVAMKNSKIKKIRIKLDKLDEKMLNIIKKRNLLVDKILSNKNKKNQIVDKKRIKIILKIIRKKSIKKKIDPKITKRIWLSMIKAFIEYEYRNFKKK